MGIKVVQKRPHGPKVSIMQTKLRLHLPFRPKVYRIRQRTTGYLRLN